MQVKVYLSDEGKESKITIKDAETREMIFDEQETKRLFETVNLIINERSKNALNKS
jgi:hypothetical protein